MGDQVWQNFMYKNTPYIVTKRILNNYEDNDVFAKYACRSAECASEPYATLSMCARCAGEEFIPNYLWAGNLTNNTFGISMISHPVQYDLKQVWNGSLPLANFSVTDYGTWTGYAWSGTQQCLIELCTVVKRVFVSGTELSEQRLGVYSEGYSNGSDGAADVRLSAIELSGRSDSIAGLAMLNALAEELSGDFRNSTIDWSFTPDMSGRIGLIVSSIADTARMASTQNAFGNNVEPWMGMETSWHIRWLWFTWPAAVEACAILLLALTVFETRRRKFPVWKTNAMAIMFRGLSEPDGMLAPGVTKISEMEGFAAGQRVKLAMNAQGCRMERVRDVSSPLP
ncbi:hypothetical protein PRZ48_000094 [Zasmidium cellare]|uniref:Uncharacterized protein n=1 Tax=Zasmidium cellare TaxID=395010 RepID=A0ABR0EXJ0_ZASCE|nr:hypothetical protein PRZ48_000094 [Zasmidium cellare]